MVVVKSQHPASDANERLHSLSVKKQCVVGRVTGGGG